MKNGAAQAAEDGPRCPPSIESGKGDTVNRSSGLRARQDASRCPTIDPFRRVYLEEGGALSPSKGPPHPITPAGIPAAGAHR